MPMVIPLVAAAFEAYAGVAALAAGAEGLAAVTAGLGIAGGALTAVGTITGNKNLTMIGSVAGLAGGIGTLASSAGDLTVDAAGEGTDAAAHGFNAAQDTGLVDDAATSAPATDAGANLAGAPTTGGIVGNANPNLATPPVTPEASSAGTMTGTPPADPNAGPDMSNGAYGGSAPPAAPTTPGAAPPATSNVPDFAKGSYGGGAQPGTAGAPPGSPYGAGPSGAPSTDGSWYSQLGDVLHAGAAWSQQNPALTKVAGGLVQGAMQYYGSQQLAEANLNRAKNYQDWARQRYSDSVRNLTVPTIGISAAPSSGIIAGAKGP
jgi:hypothetical protein